MSSAAEIALEHLAEGRTEHIATGQLIRRAIELNERATACARIGNGLSELARREQLGDVLERMLERHNADGRAQSKARRTLEAGQEIPAPAPGATRPSA